MIVPNRDLGNICFVSSAFTISTTYMHPLPSAIEIDINNVDNFDDVGRRSHSLSNVSSRSVSLVSRASSRLYHEKIMINNNLSDKEIVESIDRSQLSYSDNGQERNCVSIVTNSISPQGL